MATLRARAVSLWHHPSLWLVGANLLTRLLGFMVSLLIARSAGVASLGVYSSVMISAASLTTPISQALANNATLMASQPSPTPPWRRVLSGNAPVLALCAVAAVLGPWFLFYQTQNTQSQGLNLGLGYAVVAALALGQLMSQFMLGLAHGANRSLQVSWLVSGVMVLALLSCWPVVHSGGLPAALIQAAVVMAAPGLLLWAMALRQRAVDDQATRQAHRQDAWQRFGHATPSIGSTFINNAANWLCCIYWVQQHHGNAGVGLVAIGLQWAAVMQLPVNSWGGRIVHALAEASRQGPGALKAETHRQVLRCVGVSLLIGAAVAAVSPWIADLYNADRQLLIGLLVINAVAATLASITYVFERVFYCLENQRMWLAASSVAYVVQLIFTGLTIEHSLYAVALGNLLAIATIGVIVHMYLRARWRGA